GPQAFYDGPVADSIIRYVQERGGILAPEDLRSYRPQIDEPVRGKFCGVALYTPPPPSGGITSLGIVQTMETCGCRTMTPWNGEYFHVLAEVSKLCWRERYELLGDPDFINIPFDRLVSERAAEARSHIALSAKPQSVPAQFDQSPHTANVIATDAEGNLIS